MIISTILSNATFAIFIGLQQMYYAAWTTIILTFVRPTLTICIILLFGLYGGIIGLFSGPATVVLINIIIIKKSNFKAGLKPGEKDWHLLSIMFKYGYPLSIVSLLIGLQTQLYNYILTFYGYVSAVGYFNAAVTSSGIILMLTQPVAQELFPAFSKLEWNKQEDRSQLKESYQISIRMCNFIILPFTILMIFFAGNIFPLLFGWEIYSRFNLYFYLLFCFTFVSFGYAFIPAFLNGQKQTKTVLCLYLIGLLTGIVSSIFLIPIFQAIGAVLGFLIGNICQILFGNFMIAKKYGKDVIGKSFEKCFILHNLDCWGANFILWI